MKEISVISGGSGGLGLEIADLLVKSGKSVLIIGRDNEKLESAATRLRNSATKGIVKSFKCNIGNENEIKKIGDYINREGLSVEYLVNNAGLGLFLKAENATSLIIDRIFEANLKGMILLTSEILRLTPEDKELTIVNVMSTSSLLGRADETVYCAAKWGARGFTEALRAELKGKNRNIIAVYPGGMQTDFWKNQETMRDISSFMDPAEVAAKIVDAILNSDGMVVTDITINRKK